MSAQEEASPDFTKVQVQLPGVRKPYTYKVTGPVKAGDKVLVPPPPWDPRGSDQVAVVVAVGSDYDGHLTEVKVQPDPDSWMP